MPGRQGQGYDIQGKGVVIPPNPLSERKAGRGSRTAHIEDRREGGEGRLRGPYGQPVGWGIHSERTVRKSSQNRAGFGHGGVDVEGRRRRRDGTLETSACGQETAFPDFLGVLRRRNHAGLREFGGERPAGGDGVRDPHWAPWSTDETQPCAPTDSLGLAHDLMWARGEICGRAKGW